MKPLTIEELKALEVGDWWWVIPEGNSGRYCQVLGQENIDLFIADYLDNFEYPYETYGTRWLAYKNKEQAEEDK